LKVTIVPFAIVKLNGLKAKPEIVIVFGGGVLLGGGGVF